MSKSLKLAQPLPHSSQPFPQWPSKPPRKATGWSAPAP